MGKNTVCDMPAKYIAEDRLTENQCRIFYKILDKLDLGGVTIESALLAAREEREAFEKGLSLGQKNADLLEEIYSASSNDFDSYGSDFREGRDMTIVVMSYILNEPKEVIEKRLEEIEPKKGI